MRKRIFIACDTKSSKKILLIIKNSQTEYLKIGYKIGLEFFLSPNGRKFISKMKRKDIFLDLKLNDIPNTCSEAVKSLKDLKNIRYLTVHITGGLDMLKAIKKASKKINKKIKVLGVTVLTSLSNSSLRKVGYSRPVKDIVNKQVKLAKLAKLDGIVCSGQEINHIKKICKNMEIITPGIRMAGDKKGDQKRVMTPKKAFQNGATAIVMGRSIVDGNIKKNIQKLIKELS